MCLSDSSETTLSTTDAISELIVTTACCSAQSYGIAARKLRQGEIIAIRVLEPRNFGARR
jgi:hypothetical protein